MKLYFLLIITFAWVKCDSPSYPLNTNYNSTQLESFENNVFIGEALNYILTGSYAGSTNIPADFDNNTFSVMLEGGLQILADIMLQDPENTENQETIRKLQTILQKLNDTGTSSIYFGEIREYLTFSNAKLAIALFFSQNQKSIYERYQNYLLTQFLDGFEDGICKNHTLLWFRDIANLELWALQMFDSTAKLPTGLLNANINWLGNYKECNNVFNDTLKVGNQILPAVQGKYCRANIGFPISQLASDLPISSDFGLHIGMCFSDSCGNTEIKSIVSNSLKLLGLFKFSWVNEVKCDDTKTVEKTGSAIFFIVLLSLIISWVGIATIYDIVNRLIEFKSSLDLKNTENHIPKSIVNIKESIGGANVVNLNIPKNKSVLHKFLIDSSFYTNSEKIFRTDPESGGKVKCLNGLRLFSTIWIIWGHTYNYATDRAYFFLIDNIRDLLELNEQPYAQLIINGMYAVDTFFLMSAFVLTISFLGKWEKMKGFRLKEWIYYYVHRYWRLIFPYLIIIIISVQIMPYYGNGPMFISNDFPPRKNDCYKYWYSYILFLNNFIPDGKGTECMGYLWYIPNDFQFYLISPIFLVLLIKFPKAGLALIGFCLSASLSILALLASNVYESRRKDIIMVLIDMWEDVYIKPYNRASPYLVGILLGYLFYKLKKVNLSYKYVALGWFLSTGLALAALFGGFTNHAKDGRRMETVEYAFFFSLSRLTWPLSIGWIIFACHYGYGGLINTFLSSGVFLPLTRIGYAAYLIHPPLMQFYFYSMRSIFHAEIVALIYLPIGHIIVTFFLSYFFTLFFEVPFYAIEKLIFK